MRELGQVPLKLGMTISELTQWGLHPKAFLHCPHPATSARRVGCLQGAHLVTSILRVALAWQAAAPKQNTLLGPAGSEHEYEKQVCEWV